MKLIPLRNIIVIEREDPIRESEGGIQLIVDQPSVAMIGKVLAVGPGVHEETGKLIDCGVKPGDRIAFDRNHVKDFEIDGETVSCLQAAGIFGIVN